MKKHKQKPKNKRLNALNRIVNFQSQGKFKESKLLCDVLFKQGVNDADFLHLYGLAFRGIGDMTKAINLLEQAVSKTTDAPILNTYGIFLLETGQLAKAEEILRLATQNDPRLFDSWNSLGRTLRELEKYDDALYALNQAIQLGPNKPQPLINLALLLSELCRFKESEELMAKAIELTNPVTYSLFVKRLAIAVKAKNFNFVEKNYNLVDRSKLDLDGQAEFDIVGVDYLRYNNRYNEAINILETWLDKDTSYKEILLSLLGGIYTEVGRFDEAEAILRNILKRSPQCINARYSLGRLLFAQGVLKEGFENYEARWQWKEFSTVRRKFDIPRWTGKESLFGKSILVWREQGIGDEIRFASIIPEIKDCGENVVIECSPKLQKVFEYAFPWAIVVVEGEMDCRGLPEYVNFDYQIPVGSLAAIFRDSPNSFYQRQKPWLSRFTNKEVMVRAKLGLNLNELLIGVCWRSSLITKARMKHYLLAEDLVPLKALKNTTFLNLQYDECSEEVQRVRELGLPLIDFSEINQKDDLVSACGLIGACDLVISVGTAVCDLAAGLGVPLIHLGPAGKSWVNFGEKNIPWHHPTGQCFELVDGESQLLLMEKILSEKMTSSYIKMYLETL